MHVVQAQPGPSSILRETLLEADSTHSPIVFAEGLIQHEDLLNKFYNSQNYSLVWDEKASLQLLAMIKNSEMQGLNPADYHLQSIERLYTKPKNEYETAFLDLLLTASFFNYSSHMMYGREDPCELYQDKWEPYRPTVDLAQLLNDALATKSVTDVLEGLEPKLPLYGQLKDKLQYYRNIKKVGGWSTLADGPPIEPGRVDARIASIRKRLLPLSQTLLLRGTDDNAYDSLLVGAVKMFQRQNGLQDDGTIGPGTVQALNYSVGYYIEKIVLNLERCRWLPQELGQRYIWVNIPAYRADVIESDSILFSMRAILGRPDRMTPVFSSRISYLIYNPTWTVPPTILEEDMLPAIKRNSNYLKANRLRLIDPSGAEVQPDSLPWNRYTINNFPFIIRQDPGRFNALGLLKFEFPNHHRVYLHDTNNRALFNQHYRALSSGCIRVEKPFDIATYLLRETVWTENKLTKAIATGHTGTISFSPSIPIHIVYFTAFVDKNNMLQLRDDIYGWDSVLRDNLSAIQ